MLNSPNRIFAKGWSKTETARWGRGTQSDTQGGGTAVKPDRVLAETGLSRPKKGWAPQPRPGCRVLGGPD